MERCRHASAIINGDFTSPTLVVIGGIDNGYQVVNECLIFDSITTSQYTYKKVYVCIVMSPQSRNICIRLMHMHTWRQAP